MKKSLYTSRYKAFIFTITTLILSACGGGGGSGNPALSGGNSFTVGGNVSGLTGSLTASINNTPHTISSNGPFTFPFSFNNSSRYTITISNQPNGVLCTVSNESGTITNANVTSIDISCVNNSFSIAGTISSTALTVVDSDINDPLAATNISNNLLSSAQVINNLSTVHGFVSNIPTGFQGDRFQFTSDDADFYQVNLQSGQTINLQAVDFSGNESFQGDVSLQLLDSAFSLEASDTNNTSEFKQVTATTDGLHFILISASSGITKYTFKINSVNAVSQPVTSSVNFIPNEIIVKFKQGSPASSFSSSGSHLNFNHYDKSRASLARMTSENLSNMHFNTHKEMPAFLAELKARNENTYAKIMTLREIKRLKNQSNIEYAEPNYIYQAQRVPNDTSYNLQWHYPAINLPQAWDITTGSPAIGDVIVAVIDTGVFLAHSDLSGKFVPGFDFISSTSNSNDNDGIDNNPDDPGDNAQVGNSSWHGTHVAGTVAANSNNNSGVAGVSWDAKIMPLRVLGTQGGSSFDISEAIRFAAGLTNNSNTLPTQIADVINMSLGGPGFSQTMQDVITQARSAGVIVIAAAGNDNSSQLFFPASYTGVVSVSALDFQNNRAPYSNFGSAIDIAAPGGNSRVDLTNDGFGDGVLSTLVNDATGTRTSAFAFYQGTSMAAPHVAGVAALMKAVYPALTPLDFDNALTAGSLTNDAGSSGRDDIFGHGIVDALKAVQEARRLLNGGGTPPAPPALITATPTSLIMGTQSSAVLTLSNASATAASITNVTNNASWLTVTPDTVDANNLGTYDISINRTGLSDSIYNGTITFTLSTGNTVTVQVSMTVGNISSAGDLGTVYLLLFDTDSETVIDQVSPASLGNGTYSYTFNQVPSGNYEIVGGSDIDNDFIICQPGETCGGFPSINSLNNISVNSDLNNLDFNMDILSTINSVNIPFTIASPASIQKNDKTSGIRRN